MKKLLVGLLALSSTISFAGSLDCDFEAKNKCWEKARKEILYMNGIRTEVIFTIKNNKGGGGLDRNYSCVVVSEPDVFAQRTTDLAEYRVKTSQDVYGWCEAESIILIDNL